ncbi:hypothetical protein A1O3_05494 [Capronia epimyces CBS 606.96]|uniref:AAA+ ATPase domain-containing protein n=1 Tax=Capronia epimyces CBS 606.96 TaxID=1182542 RepID=W9Y6H6_9EURO|nr:uncharacterized protein A1O3_05494 [Capronia epimyces CBS 606.96]EXJ84821.1 hypothetical protein A1O3_05494 [Capronia epimyces CBS 606.96]
MSNEDEPHSLRSAKQPSTVITYSRLDSSQAASLADLGDKIGEEAKISHASETLWSMDSDVVPQTTGPHTTGPLSEAEMPRSTPKKTTLRVDSNGKLTNSPQHPSRRSPRTKKGRNDQGNGAITAARSSRKIEMKNGKFVSSLRVTLHYKTPDCGRKIDEILSRMSNKSAPTDPVAQSTPTGKVTHPFFLGRLASKAQKQSLVKSELSTAMASDNDTNRDLLEAPKPWKDIIFASKKPFQSKVTAGLPSIWPPLSLQRIQPNHDKARPQTVLPPPARTLKSKHHVSTVSSLEDVLWNFACNLKDASRGQDSLHLPTRMLMSGKALNAGVDAELCRENEYADHVTLLRTRIESTLNPFNKGMAAGPQMWPQEYAPTCWQEVLQPQTQVLHDWLRNLKVHQIQSGKLQPKPKPSIFKKRRKRPSDDMDDFIVNSDDEHQASSGKHAILITGPCGCGKTAAVFAVAQQLGFEVFEIHAGMRRSARDIQEKVGDMTQNHLVQQADSLSRGSSMSLDDSNAANSPYPEQLATNQPTMANFMNPNKGATNQKATGALGGKEAKIKAQKQSLILLEEVDILFEEDKGFWSGVQSLIRTSKRPVIMTCNNPESVPLDELDLFTILTFDHPEMKPSVERLAYIAAAEGHLLSKRAIEDLYLSKGRDLRASLTELSLWCQMAVGSQQGGLDWMLPPDVRRQATQDGALMRIVSQDTFVSGLDLYPTELDDPQDVVKFSHESLCLSPSDWVKEAVDLHTGGSGLGIRKLDEILLYTDVQSVMDVVDSDVACLMAGMVMKNRASEYRRSPRHEILHLCLEQQTTTNLLTRAAVADALEALTEENRIGLPVSPGRKAPSIDNAAQSIVTEVAPYVRSIVEHDQRLEHIRNELGGGGSQTKRQRRTKASRAALEGGSKVTTRRDRWFPETLDYSAVLATGGNGWPQVRTGEVELPSAAPTPSSSMATEIECDALDASK